MSIFSRLKKLRRMSAGEIHARLRQRSRVRQEHRSYRADAGPHIPAEVVCDMASRLFDGHRLLPGSDDTSLETARQRWPQWMEQISAAAIDRADSTAIATQRLSGSKWPEKGR